MFGVGVGQATRLSLRLFLSILLATSLVGCSSPPLPPSVAAAGWNDVRSSDRDEVHAQLIRMHADSRSARGVFTYRIVDPSGTEVEVLVTRADGWSSVVLDGRLRLWEGEAAGSVSDPVTVWARDALDGELERDLVVCAAGTCTDVSAWFKLAAFEEFAPLPERVGGLRPQEVYQAALIGALEPSVINYYIEHLDDPVNGWFTDESGSKAYDLNDRSYVYGHRAGRTGSETCIGWFDRQEDLFSDDERFARFCHSPVAGVTMGSGKDALLSHRPIVPGTFHRPDTTADLYLLVDEDFRRYLESMGVVDSVWAARHTRV